MARGESPYKGHYTVPTIDFSPIERGGAAWGEAFKGIGKSIEKYGLKKEQQKKDKGKLKGLTTTIESLKESDESDSAMIYDAALAALRDEDVPQSERLAQGEEIMRGLNVSSVIQGRQMSTEAMRMANEFQRETKEARKAVVNLQAINEGMKSQLDAWRAGKSEKEWQNEQERKKAETKSITGRLTIAEKEEARAAGLSPLTQAIEAGKVLKLDAETKVLNKKLNAVGVDENRLEPVMDDQGNPLPNTFYNKSGTMVYVDTTNPKKPTVTTISTTLAGARAEVRLRLGESLKTLGDMPAGKFWDFEGTDHDQPLSINQYVNVLDFGVQDDDELHWKDGEGNLRRFDIAKFPKIEELERRTNKSEPQKIGDRVDAYLKARDESASLSDSGAAPVGEDEDTSIDEVEETISDIFSTP